MVPSRTNSRRVVAFGNVLRVLAVSGPASFWVPHIANTLSPSATIINDVDEFGPSPSSPSVYHQQFMRVERVGALIRFYVNAAAAAWKTSLSGLSLRGR